MNTRYKVTTSEGRILRSRYVMEQHLGRKLRPEEVVHHKDENPQNDAIENLKLYATQAEHAQFHSSKRRTRPDSAVCLTCGITYKVPKKGRRPKIKDGKGYCSTCPQPRMCTRRLSVVPSQSSLTDAQCAEIAAWSKSVEARIGEAPAIKAEHDRIPGQPVMASRTLFAHPEDYLALQRWADRQEPLGWLR